MQSSISALWTSLAASGAALDATYARAGASVMLQMLPADLLGQEEVENGVPLAANRETFVIRAADLEDLAEPQDGDYWSIERAGATTVFDLVSAAGEAMWSWYDPWRTLIRLHGVAVGSGEA